MIKEINICNFRAIKELKIQNFKHVNFFFGRANSGKTSVLEALHIFAKENNKSLQEIGDDRINLADEDVIEGLFYDYNIGNNIKIFSDQKEILIQKKPDDIVEINEGATLTKKEVTFDLLIKDKPKTTMIFSIMGNNRTARVQTQSVLNDKNYSAFIGTFKLNEAFYKNIKKINQNNALENKLNQYCKDFDNKIEGISLIGDSIYVKIRDYNTKINLKLMGQGFIGYLSYISAMLLQINHIMIDEIENGLHFDHIKLLLENILNISKEHNIQFFITTHSKEILQNLAKIAEENIDMIACYNIYEENSKIKVLEYNTNGFITDMQAGNEVRD